MSRFRNPHEAGSGVVVPYFLVLLFILLASIPANFFYMAKLEIGLYFVPLFFIGLMDESDAAPVFVAVLGLLNDVLSEMPLGFGRRSMSCFIFYASASAVFYRPPASALIGSPLPCWWP